MKKLLLIIFVVSLASCSKWSSDKENFVNAYKDIILVRATVADSAKANRDVEKIYKKYNYTKESFKRAYFIYAANQKEFLEMLDSARIRKEREIRDLQKSRFNLKEKE